MDFSLATLSPAVFLVAASCIGIWIWWRKRSFFDSPIYLALLTYITFFGLGPLVKPEYLQWYPISTSSVVLCWVGFVTLALGYAAGNVRYWRKRKRANSLIVGGRGVILHAGLLLTVMGISGVVIYIAFYDGFDNLLFINYGTARNHPPVVEGLCWCLRPGLQLLVGWAMTRRRISRLFVTFLFVYIGFDFLWFGPLRGARHHIIGILLSLVCLAACVQWTGHRSPFRIPKWTMIAIFSVTALVWGGLRSFSIHELVNGRFQTMAVQDSATQAVTGSLYAPYVAYSRVVDEVPELVPFQRGSTLFESLTVFIPRSLWQNKPIGLGTWITEAFYGMKTARAANTVLTWPGELYLNFGTAGVVFGMGFTGLVCSWITRWSPRYRQGGRFTGIEYAAFFCLPFDLIWGGSNAAMWLLAAAFPVWLAMFAGRMVSSETAQYPGFYSTSAGVVAR